MKIITTAVLALLVFSSSASAGLTRVLSLDDNDVIKIGTRCIAEGIDTGLLRPDMTILANYDKEVVKENSCLSAIIERAQ